MNGGEGFGLVWPGKADAIRAAGTPPTGTLVPCPAGSGRLDAAESLFIEGDNLEALKLLRRDYAGRVHLIYTDPPYNARAALLYRDDFGRTAGAGPGGGAHAAWLSMIYPRLAVARELLRPDGLICVSIGDAELANLRLVMEEIFGPASYVNTVSVKTKVAAGASGGGEDRRLKKNVEYLLIFARDPTRMKSLAGTFTEEPLAATIARMRARGESWKYTSVLIDPGRPRRLTTLEHAGGEPIEVLLCEPVRRTTIAAVCRDEGLCEEGAYRKHFDRVFSDTNAQTSIRTRLIEACGPLAPGQAYQLRYVPRSGRDRGRQVIHTYVSPTVRRVIWLSDVARLSGDVVMKKTRLGTLWDGLHYNNVGKEGGIRFPHGKKPVELVRRCLSLVPDRDALVLDFFAGSCSTAHAVLEQNAQDGGRRHFLCIQSPEPLPGHLHFPTIAELGKARIRNAIAELNRRGEHTWGQAVICD